MKYKGNAFIKMNITLRDVAKLARTSKSTVSRVLLGQPDVNARTRLRVERAVKRTGYRPNVFARGLSGGRTGIVAALGRWMGGDFMMDVMRGIHDEAANHLNYVICRVALTPAEYINAWQRFVQEGMIDGIILIAPPCELYQDRPEAGHVPSVLCASRPPKDRRAWSKIDSVVLDNERAMTELLLHLVDQGCRRLVHLEGNADNYDTRERSRCFREFITRCPEVAGEVIPASERRALVRLKVREYLDQKKSFPDAFIGFNDDIAMGVIDGLKERGIHIPSDVAVTGFDDSAVASVAELTSVRVPAYMAGRESVRTLFARLNCEVSEDTPQRVTMDLPLQIRTSSLLHREQHERKKKRSQRGNEALSWPDTPPA